MQYCFNMYITEKYINIFNDIDHIIISIDSEKAFNKDQLPFIIKASKKLETGETYINNYLAYSII